MPPVRTAPADKSRGRPRSFDRAAALEAAMLLFWRHGYEGASIARLADAMGVNAPSLYAAFGAKDQLYRESLQLYLGGMGDIGVSRLNEAKTAQEGVRAVLAAAAIAFTRPGYPPGCMVGVGSLRCAEENRIVAEETAALRKRSQAAFLQRLRQAVKARELPRGTDLVAIADFYSSVIEGMSVQAQDGASRARLQHIGDMAMRAWQA
jgi:AcrR family transcriptional regulator